MGKKRHNDTSDAALDSGITTNAAVDRDEVSQASDDGAAERMAAARAARGRQIKNGVKRTPRLLFVCEQGPDGRIGRVVKVVPNKYRLRKWLSVAEDITPGLTDRLTIIRGKQQGVEETLE